MQGRRTRRICVIAWGWLLAGGVLAQTGDTTAARPHVSADQLSLGVAGNDRVAWLIVGRFREEEQVYVYRFARLDTSSSRVEPVRRIRPQKGTMRRWAVVGDALHVFYAADARYTEEGAHYCYDESGGGSRAPLPGPAMPLAVAGTAAGQRPALWAVVPTETAAAVAVRWYQARQEALPETEPSPPSDPAEMEVGPPPLPSASGPVSSSDTDFPGVVSAGEPAVHLVRFDGTGWVPGLPGPPGCTQADRIWLAVGDDDRFHLIWQPRGAGATLEYAWWDLPGGRWRRGTAIELGREPARVFVGLVNRNLIVSTLGPSGSDSTQWICRTWAWSPRGTSGSWRGMPPLGPPGGEADKTLQLPPGSALGCFADQLVVVRPAGQGAEVALFSPLAGGPPTQGFQEVPLFGGSPESPAVRGLRDLAATLAVVALLLLVFWRRQDAVMIPATLPAGVEIARPGRRIAAALLDMLPAGILVTISWHEPMERFAEMFWPAFMSGRSEMLEQVPWPATLTWAGVWFRLLYTAYCLAFELVWHATPGKRLMGCVVRMETFEPARPVAVVIRNVTKLVELEPYLQIWPFILVIFFTRNHQRLGDLLGRTVVVRGQPLGDDHATGRDERGPHLERDNPGDG